MTRGATYPQFSRNALAPGLLGGIILIAGLALIGNAWFTGVLYATSILALIMCVFAAQARSWWWLIGLVPIAVVWNPVFPIALPDLMLRLLHLAAAIVFIAAGILIRTPTDTRR
ncbi:MAG TPA: DUF6804 family protein [Microbacteriaceae bacterium]|nr:DUF6804 family protein [Microbacteriaceae bacterium]